MKLIHIIAFILLIIGGLNWGLVGAFDYNLVGEIGLPSGVVNTIYVLVGLSAVFEAVTHKANCRRCSMTGSAPAAM